MADASNRKTEILAAARKKLKQFQQKKKESAVTNARSTPSSQKSSSPVDNLNLQDQSQPPKQITHEESVLNIKNENNNLDETSRSNSALITNGTSKSEITLFSFNSSANNNENFFDNLTALQNNGNSNSPLQDKNVIQIQSSEIDQSKSEAPVFPVPTSTVDEIPSIESNHFKEEECNNSRILELENWLHLERKNNEELQKKILDNHSHILSLQQEIKRLNEEQNYKVAQEVIQLEEKLRFQLQTIEILVSEKSELQKELMLLQEENKTTKSSTEELASRLKASRSQVQKLEKELSERSETKSQHNGILKKLENELQQKESIVQEALKNLNEARNEIRELERRIEVGLRDQGELRRQIQEKDKQLSMAQIKLAQLGGEADGNSLKEIESLKGALEKAQKDTETAIEEKKKCETELRQYIGNLNAQVLQANAKCERAEKDKEELNLRVEELVKHISELEKQLQRERNVREAADDSEVVHALRQEVVSYQELLANKEEKLKSLENELDEIREKLSEAERWKENVPDMGLLQAAMESDRVAAARAIEQNNTLKQKLNELEEYIIKLNNSKLELTEELDKYRHMAGEYRLQLEKYKSRQEMRMVDSVTQTNHIRKANSVSQTTVHDIATTAEPHEPVSVETLVMIEDKLKKTMDRVADLSDEKQRLEHLVLQLQSETETIGEYVTLYQNQRSLLKEKADEKERQMAVIAKEREELKAKLNEINTLLTKFPHNPEVENTTCKISSLLGEIQSSSIVQEKAGPPPTFHPCLLCSGKLINV